MLAALRHQNLPRVIDYFVIDKEQFLVMDFIPGEDLGKRLKAEGARNWMTSCAGQPSYHPPWPICMPRTRR